MGPPGDRRGRVLAVVDSLAAGGAQRHLAALCREMNGGPFPTDVFSLTDKGDFFSASIAEAGSRVEFGASRRRSLAAIALRLSRMLGEGHYALVHSYLPAAFLFSALLPARRGLPHVTTICAREAQISSRLLSFRNYGRLKRRTDLYITPFPSQMLALGVPAAKVRFAMFATDYELDKRVRARADNPVVRAHGVGPGPVVLAVGRMHPDKGHEHAIRAHERVRARFPAATLLLLGEGADEARLRRLAGPGVIFCGVHRELAPFYSLADVYLNTAVNEGLNLSQLQAMAYGVPTVAFDTGFMEYEQEGKERAMVRVPVGDGEALAASIVRLLSDTEHARQVREAARGFAAQYGVDRVYRQYVAAYEEVLGAGSAAGTSS